MRKTILLILLIILVVMITAGSMTSVEAFNIAASQGGPKITWIGSQNTLINQYRAIAGFLNQTHVYEYFEVTGGSGEISITVNGYTESFFVLKGNTYRIKITANLVTSQTSLTTSDTIISISSPSADNDALINLESRWRTTGGTAGREQFQVIDVNNIEISTWELSPPKRPLDNWPVPEGAPTSINFDSHARAQSKYYTADGNNHFFDVTWGADQFVAVGSQGMIYTSSDGVNWVEQHSGTDHRLNNIVWNGSQFVIVGSYSTILTSEDGVNWTKQVAESHCCLYGIIWAENQFLAVGSDGLVLTSLDGISWTKQYNEIESHLLGISWSGNNYVAVGYDYDDNSYAGALFTSQDGAIWTKESIELSGWLVDVVWGDNQYVVIGYSRESNRAVVFTSTDGFNWTKTELDTIYWVNSVTWVEEQYFAVGYGVYTSHDALAWTEQNAPARKTFNGVTSGNELIVVVGFSEIIITSPEGIEWTVVQEYDKAKSVLYKLWHYNDINQATETVIDIDGVNYSATAGPGGLVRTVIYYNHYTETTYYHYNVPSFAVRRGVVNAEKYNLTITVEGQGNTLPVEGVHEYYEGSEVVLSASPEDGWQFDKWVVNEVEVFDTTTALIMDSDKSATVHFVELDTLNLASLVISVGTMEPAFAPDITSYTVNVAHNTDTIDVTATLANSESILSINGKLVESGSTEKVTLNAPGSETIIEVGVTAEGETASKTYTITVHRAESPECDITTPALPTGQSNGVTGEHYNYSTGGSTCAAYHDVQYRFDWGDGSVSDWSNETVRSHSWKEAGEYDVRAQARCVENSDCVSLWSDGLVVTITTPDPDPDPDPGEKKALYVQNPSTGQVQAWVLAVDAVDPASSKIISRPVIGSAPAPQVNWHVAAVHDIDGSGSPDLIWHNSDTGQRRVWKMNGFNKAMDLPYGKQDRPNLLIVDLHDLDGDGKVDAVLQNPAGGRFIWFMDGHNKLEELRFAVAAHNWNIVGVEDMDGNGRTNLIWEHKLVGGRNYWTLSEKFDRIDIESGQFHSTGPFWKIVAVHDMDGDGKPDVIWEHRDNGNRSMWLIDEWPPQNIEDIRSGVFSKEPTDWFIVGAGTIY